MENKLAVSLIKGCNVSPSPTDVSPTENSWMLHPLDKVSLDCFAPDWTIPSLNSDLIGVLCVGRACIRRRGANPINLVRGVGEAGQTSHWSIRCRRPTELAPCLTLSRVGTHRSGAWYPRDALFKGSNIQEFSVGDPSVGEISTLHPLKQAGKIGYRFSRPQPGCLPGGENR